MSDEVHVSKYWRTVPVEPSPEMRSAGLQYGHSLLTVLQIWHAMVAAAPFLPEESGAEMVRESVKQESQDDDGKQDAQFKQAVEKVFNALNKS
jgi:hypothetical protein